MTEPLPMPEIDRLRTIDSIADRFEAAWSSGTAPRIEEYLAEVAADQQGDLLGELLAIELEWRSRFGQAVDADSYRQRFAESTRIVDAVLTEWSHSAPTPAAVESAVQSLESTLVPAMSHPAGSAGSGIEPALTQLGRYRIVRQLGAGAMGVVYLAQDEELHRPVALKIPRTGVDPDGGLLERFQREARAAAALNHPGICAVYDVGVWDGVRYITMAYIDGRPLQQVARGGRRQPERQIALLIRKLALALQAAHEQGVVHRDLKPANILLTTKHEPVIMDFGLALLTNRQEDARLTKDGMIVGSPAYMSPEQVSGDPNAVGPSSDIYSLGVIAYELLTGRLPYQGNVIAVIGQIQTTDPPPIHDLQPTVNPALEAIVARMMARSLDQRYDSMQKVGNDLARWLRGSQTSAAPESAPSIQVSGPPGQLGRRAVLRTPGPLKLMGIAITLAAVFLLGVLLIVRTNQGDVRIEALDERIAIELDGDRITLREQRWAGRKPPGKHHLGVLINGARVPIGEALPILVDGMQHRLVASLGNVKLTASEFEVQRGRTAAINLALLPVAETNGAPTAEKPPAAVESPSPNPRAVDFRSQVQATATFLDEFQGDLILRNLPDKFRIGLRDGRMEIELPTHQATSTSSPLATFDEGLLEIDVRTVSGEAGPQILLSRTALNAFLSLSVRFGALHLSMSAPGVTSKPEVISTKLPLRREGFDRFHFLIGRSTLDIAINGERVGSTITVPFQLTPDALLSLGILKTPQSAAARVEYERVTFYPAKGSLVARPVETVPAERIVAAGQEIDLLKVTSLDVLYRNGPWIHAEDGLRCGVEPPGAHKLELPVRPQGEYDLDIEFTCAGSEPAASMRLPLPGTRFSGDYTLASYGGKAMGIVIRNLSMLDLPDPAGHQPSPLKLEQRHRATARVRKRDQEWSITGLIDGQELVRWQGAAEELSLHDYWRSPDLKRPLVGQWGLPNLSITIHEAKLTVVSGVCHLMP